MIVRRSALSCPWRQGSHAAPSGCRASDHDSLDPLRATHQGAIVAFRRLAMGDHDSLDEAPHLLVTARGQGEREALHLHQERAVPGLAAALASSGQLEVRLLELGDQ